MPVITTTFECKRDVFTIRGKEIHKKGSEGKLIPIIISHGFTGDMNGTTPYGEFLAENGYRAFVFDFCGGGFHTISDGSFEDDMTPITETYDLKSVIDYVTSRDDVNAEKLILMGCSQGGFVSSLVAAQLNERVNQLILFYPALCIPDDARNGSMQVIHFDPNHIPDHVGVSPMRVCGDYPRSVLKIDIFKEIIGYHGPVFIIHGTADQIVPVRYAKKANEVYQANGNNVHLELIEGAPHGFFKENYFTDACFRMKKWLDR